MGWKQEMRSASGSQRQSRDDLEGDDVPKKKLGSDKTQRGEEEEEGDGRGDGKRGGERMKTAQRGRRGTALFVVLMVNIVWRLNGWAEDRRVVQSSDTGLTPHRKSVPFGGHFYPRCLTVPPVRTLILSPCGSAGKWLPLPRFSADAFLKNIYWREPQTLAQLSGFVVVLNFTY